MIWTARYCSARNRKGQPCGNRSSDGRGGLCWAHRRQVERLAVEVRRLKERRQLAEHLRNPSPKG